MSFDKIYKVATLMATRNGINWIAEQVTSILNQDGVSITLIVSDDASTDGTWEWLSEFSLKNEQVILLPRDKVFGSAGKNFYRLINAIDADNYDFVALADQDDIWLNNKLQKQIALATQYHADGVSSNVVAFWQDGSRALIDKAESQRRLDFLFESSGPGCTFVLSPWLVTQVQKVLNNPESIATEVALHDWLIYAICRASGRRWHINPVPGMKYRQHGNNVMGVNFGYKTRLARFRLILNGWYRGEVIKICNVSMLLTSDPYLKSACKALQRNLLLRLSILKFINQSRRRLFDRLILAGSIMLCFF